jgi:DNA-3-methyladenine glycosylase II
MNFELISDSPYNLTRCALVFSQFPQDGTDVWVPPREILPAQYCRLHVIEGDAVLAVVQQGQDKEDGKARLLVRTYPSRPKHLAVLKSRVAWQFHLDADLGGFYRRAQKHPLLRPLIKALYGVKPLRPSTLFEMAVMAITEQQLSYQIAVKMRSRMVDALGEKYAVDGRLFKAFPSPQVLGGFKISDLRAFSLSARKAEYIIDLAKKVSTGFDIEGLKERTNEEVVETLTSLRGFGRWSAEYFISRGLGRTQVIAADDLGIQTFVGKYLGPGRRVSAEECRRIMKPWSPYQRWVVFYLFCSSRLGLLK